MIDNSNRNKEKILDENRIREKLLLHLSNKFTQEAIILNELTCSSKKLRADVAVLDNYWYSFEIKSKIDSLQKLAKQLKYYNYNFDYNIVVTTEKHLPKTNSIIKDFPFWGIYIITNDKDEIQINIEREASLNSEKLNLEEILSLLWKEELIQIINNFSGEEKFKSLTNVQLRSKLITILSITEAKSHIKEFLKKRENGSWLHNKKTFHRNY